MDSPINVFILQLLNAAKAIQASDIHIMPTANDYHIQLRIDGILNFYGTIPFTKALQCICRLKHAANLDIAEQRLPQDGYLNFTPGFDMRINTVPTIYGEKIAIRLFHHCKQHLDLTLMGYTTKQLKFITEKILFPHGLILLTGPTGSGKTTTLYSILNAINDGTKHIVTIEDPIEIKLAGINQTQVEPKIGLTFPIMLRALLRQDPDVLIVGEIRDKETAQIAIQAALTGHLVLATLHCFSAHAAFTRLRHFNICHNDIVEALLFISNQRLFRLTHENDYKGRSGLFEIVHCSNNNISYFDRSLSVTANAKLIAGLTNSVEIKRVLGEYHWY